MFRTLIAGAVLALAASTAQATDTQIVSGSGIRGLQIQHAQPIGQSFIATDTNLTSFGFEFQNFNAGQFNAPVTLTLRSGAGTSGDIITTRTVTLPTQPDYPNDAWFDFDLTGTTLVAGQTYTALLTTTSTLLGVIYGPDLNIFTGQPLSGDAYAGGQIYAAGDNLDGYCSTSGACDLNFRFSGTTPTAVPEPASWAMMLGGFGMIGGAMRQRRRTVRFA
jgi:hypothetical protein